MLLDRLFQSLTVEGRKECKYKLILACGTLNLWLCPLVIDVSGVNCRVGILIMPLMSL